MINIKEENDLLLALMKNENIKRFRKISAHLGSWLLILIHLFGEKNGARILWVGRRA